MVLQRWFAAILLLLTTGCSSMKPDQFEGREPRLLIEDYLAGNTRAWGLFEDRFGNLRREFVVDIEGTWDGETLTLVEDFVYSDGETQQRIWTIKKLDEHRYSGTAADVIGEAEGISYGNALNWRYMLALPIGESVWNVHFDDWSSQLQAEAPTACTPCSSCPAPGCSAASSAMVTTKRASSCRSTCSSSP